MSTIRASGSVLGTAQKVAHDGTCRLVDRLEGLHLRRGRWHRRLRPVNEVNTIIRLGVA